MALPLCYGLGTRLCAVHDVICIDSQVFFTLPKVARRANVQVRTVRRWLADGKLRASRPAGRECLVTASCLRRFLKTREIRVMRDTITVNGVTFYSVGKVADVCGVSPKTVERWIHSGRLRSSKSAGRRLVKITDLRAFLEGGVARGSAGSHKG